MRTMIGLILMYSFFPVTQGVKSGPKNPTSYVYDFDMQTVKNVKVKELSKLQVYRYIQLDYVGKNWMVSPIAEQIFEDKENRNDFYLSYSGSIDPSRVYNVFDSLKSKIREASLQSIREQIRLGYNELDQLDKLNSRINILEAKDGLRNNFLEFIEGQDNFKKGLGGTYLIEVERSGEVFEALNILYSSNKNIGYRYKYENRKWTLAEEVSFAFSLDLFFEGLTYRLNCREGNYASIDYLSITKISDDSSVLKTKALVVICKDDYPKEFGL